MSLNPNKPRWVEESEKAQERAKVSILEDNVDSNTNRIKDLEDKTKITFMEGQISGLISRMEELEDDVKALRRQGNR